MNVMISENSYSHTFSGLYNCGTKVSKLSIKTKRNENVHPVSKYYLCV